MANLNDLPIPTLRESGLQLILDVRSRRGFIPEKEIRQTKSKILKSLVSKQPIPTEQAIAHMSEQQITDLYYKLMAKQQQELL